MSSVKAKKRLMYLTFAFIFLFGGIEYAVILPTIWLYLHNTYDAPEYMLGLVLSAYSFAAFLSAPVFGRFSDKVRCTKKIFLVCAMFEMVGSFLYFIGISQWLCVASRFISGLGAASEAIALAEVARYTTEQERTGIISNLIATRQIALLLGPALNLFLRLADFKLGPFSVTKYSAPGAFMVVIWVLLMLVVLLLYTEPMDIYSLERKETKQVLQGAISNDASQDISANGQAVTDEPNRHATVQRKAYAYTDSRDFLASDDGAEIIYPPVSSEKPFAPPVYHDWEDSEDMYYEAVREGEASAYTAHRNINSVTRGKAGSVTHSGEFRNPEDTTPAYFNPQEKGSNEFYDNINANRSGPESDEYFHDPWNHSGSPGAQVDLSSSVEILATAERLINSNQLTVSEKDIHASTGGGGAAADAGDGLLFYDDHFSLSSQDGLYSNGVGPDADERTALLGAMGSRRRQNRSVTSQPGENDPYIERSLTALDDPISREGKLGFCCNEYIRDEIVAILCLLFCAMFSQVCVETMVLPLSLKYLDFGELENSILYFVCGVEIIAVFLALTRLTRCISDRVLIMFGAVMILSSNIWLLYFLPSAPPHDRSHNIPLFGIAVVLDVLSLPFLFVCSTSLFSKLTRKETQGLSQGVRRAVVGVGTIMAPLWGSSASTNPDLLVGVLVALQGLSLVLCTLSFPRLKVPSRRTPDSERVPVSPPADPIVAANASANHRGGGGEKNANGGATEEEGNEESGEFTVGASINSIPVDRSRRHFVSPTTPGDEEFFNSPRGRASTGFLTPYGSMHQSVSGSSFHSMMSSESGGGQGGRLLLPSPVI